MVFDIWNERYERHGVAGLRDQSRRPHHFRLRIPTEIVSLILHIPEERRYAGDLCAKIEMDLSSPELLERYEQLALSIVARSRVSDIARAK